MRKWNIFGLCVLGLCLANILCATPIVVFNTGVDGSGNVLVGGANDPHYTLIASTAVVVNDGAFPIPPWVLDNTTSKWIGPRADAAIGSPDGNYTYQTTFSLAGLAPATASLSGQWSSDNAGVAILLNGHDTGNTIAFGTDPNYSFAHFTPFSITNSSWFLPGENTLEFVVNNFPTTGANPTGLRVEISGNADSIPEPATLALAGLGLLGLGYFGRRFARR